MKTTFDYNNDTHRQGVIDMVIHTCDMGNPALEFCQAREWSYMILAEFNNQVAVEEELGLPVSEFLRVGVELEKIKRT
jgi:hypothetical protein